MYKIWINGQTRVFGRKLMIKLGFLPNNDRVDKSLWFYMRPESPCFKYTEITPSITQLQIIVIFGNFAKLGPKKGWIWSTNSIRLSMIQLCEKKTPWIRRVCILRKLFAVFFLRNWLNRALYGKGGRRGVGKWLFNKRTKFMIFQKMQGWAHRVFLARIVRRTV